MPAAVVDTSQDAGISSISFTIQARSVFEAGASAANPNISIQSRIASSPSSNCVGRSKCHALLTSNPLRFEQRRVLADAWEVPWILEDVAPAFKGDSRCVQKALRHFVSRRIRQQSGRLAEAMTRCFGSPFPACRIQCSAAFENTASNSPGSEKLAASASLNSRSRIVLSGLADHLGRAVQTRRRVAPDSAILAVSCPVPQPRSRMRSPRDADRGAAASPPQDSKQTSAVLRKEPSPLFLVHAAAGPADGRQRPSSLRRC